MESLDQLKSFVEMKIEEEQESVSSIYIAHVQPFLAAGGSIDEFLTPNEFLIQFPPGIIKIRRCVFQILLLINIFQSQNNQDPLSVDNMNELLLLLRSIAPLAPIISESMLLDIFEEIGSIYGERYPQTIDFLMKSIGITEDDMSADLFVDQTGNPHRIHYEDGEVVQTGLEFQPNKTVLQNFPLFQTSECRENKKIKKPKHGPEISWKSTH